MRFSCNCRKHFDKHWVSEAASLGIDESWLWDNQITAIKGPAEWQVGFESGTLRFYL